MTLGANVALLRKQARRKWCCLVSLPSPGLMVEPEGKVVMGFSISTRPAVEMENPDATLVL